MSTLPCDGHGQIIRGRLLGCYPTLLQDGVRQQSYKRLCPDCVRDLLAKHQKDWRDSFLSDHSGEQHSCYSCGTVAEHLGTLRRFFCTVYVDSKTRRDYSAYYCQDCTDFIREEFGLHA